jgi:hypothetical protein
LLFLGSCTLFGLAAGQTGQGEPLAEQQFKNIQSFKGAKASDVMPAMEFMSAALKVDCDFCHTADRASDDKQEKRAARSMIAMQREINANHFNGRNEVTCATCHNGNPHPQSVPPVQGLEVRARRAPDLKPADILAQFAKTAGAGPVAALRLSGKSTMKGETAPVDATYLGEKFLIVRHTPKGDIKFGYNGQQLWYAAPGFSTVIPGEVAERFKNQSALYLTGNALPKLPNPSAGTAKVGTQDAVVVSGAFPGSTTRTSMFVDKKDGRLLRASYSYPTVLGTIVEIIEFKDYRRVGGAEVPMTILLHTADSDETRRFTSAKQDPNVPSSTFDMPKS